MSTLKFKKEPKLHFTFWEVFGVSCAEFRAQVRANIEAGYSMPEKLFYLLPNPLKRIYIKELYRVGEQPYTFDNDEYDLYFMREAVRLCPKLVKEDVEGLIKQWHDDGNGEYELYNEQWKEILAPLNINYNDYRTGIPAKCS